MDGGESHPANDTSTAIGLSTSKPKTQTKKRILAKQISAKKKPLRPNVLAHLNRRPAV